MVDFFAELEEDKKPVSNIDFHNILDNLEKDIDLPVENAGPPGLDDLLTRFNVSGGVGYQEKVNEFKAAYPEGDLVYKRFDGEDKPRLAFRKTTLDNWSKLDKNFWAGEGTEIVADLVDIAGEDLYEILGEIGATIGTGGLSLPLLMGRIALGNVAGSMTREIDQTWRGTQAQTLPEQLTHAGTKAGIATATGGAVELGVRKLQHLTGGGGTFKQTPEGYAAGAAAKRLGAPDIPAHLLVEHPWLQRIGKQAQAVLPGIDEYVSNARKFNKTILGQLKAARGRGTFRGDLSNLEAAYRNKLLRITEESVGIRPELNVAMVGDEVMQAGIKEYDKLSQSIVSGLYSSARRLEEPVFDLGSLRTQAKAILDGERGAKRFKANEKTGILEEIAGRQARELMDADVRKVLKEIVETAHMESRVINGSVITPTDQLNYWAEAIGPYTVAGSDGVSYRTQKIASEIYGALRKSLDNPKNLDSSPQFGAAWAKARLAARQRFDTLRKVAEAKTTIQPIEYIRNAYGKQGYEKLRNLKSAMPTGRFNEIQSGYLKYLLEPGQIDNLSTTLREMRPEFKSLLFNKTELHRLTTFSSVWDSFNKLNVQGKISRQTDFRALIGDLVSDQSSSNISTLKTLIKAGGGPSSPLGRNIRAGLVDNIHINSLDKDGKINASKMRSIIKEWRKTGAIKLLPISDWKTLLDLAKVEQIYMQGTDAGTSLVAASAASKMGHLNPSAIKDLLKSKLWSRFLVSDQGKRLLVGKGGKRWGTLTGLTLATSSLQKILTEDGQAERDMQRILSEHGR